MSLETQLYMGKKQLVKKSHSGYGKNPSFSGFQCYEVLEGKRGLKAGLVFVERNFQWHIENPQWKGPWGEVDGATVLEA